ncbi:MAG: FAD-dependent oxidoreductase [Firmicutes bacterium]|nr:FAD-dependent oxidoreductase [Bacillota bacterium]
MEQKKYDCIVIGAGVSGMTAALYLKRAGLDVLLLEREVPGGQINRTSEIENYPGFLSIDGPTFAMNIYEQVNYLHIPMVFEDVTRIVKDTEIHVITNSNEYVTDKLIIASGRAPRKLNLEHENQYTGRGISYCALCDGAFYKDKTVGVIGSGNSALEEAIYLARICKKVIMLNRSEKFKGSTLLQERLKECSNVEYRYNTHVTGLIGDGDRLTGIQTKCLEKEEEMVLDGIFVYIGSSPNTEFLKDTEVKLDNGFIEVDKNMCTNIKHIYACGDCTKKEVYQLTTAVGDAAVAATTAQK